ncbi:MAG TPA: acyl-ACP--UDP-N-acetylglucosamine O-acyltransferase [Vicinamibacteria bacterium]|nr:acyl-ACP--UDP-N-acetylglucosamine O-acyltransferase [Vicinamibacteria bacterium]
MTVEVHPTAVVAPGARLGSGVRLGPYAVVEDETSIGDRCEIRAHATVKRYTTLGADNVVHEGAVLGGEPQDVAFTGEASELRIGSGNRIREGVTIHRGTRPGSATVVGSECFLMAYAHVAHDDVLGDRVILANNVALAGHVTIGERAFLSAGAGVHQFCRIGRIAMIGGHSKVVQDCLPFVITAGAPARARGLNLVGLRRAGFKATDVRALEEGYRLLLRSSLRLDDALERLAALQDPHVDELAAFARAARRGFAHHRSPGASERE